MARHTAEERFWKYVEKRPCGCWDWIGARQTQGYGVLRVKRKNIKAHRFSYALHYGPIPQEVVVRHLCNRLTCVNPDHLAIGTHADNYADRVAAGRHGRDFRTNYIDERTPREPLTPKQRFWEKVNKDGPVKPGMESPCWMWLGATTKGYGRFAPSQDRRNISAHRFAFELVNEPIPTGLAILHRCDTPLCVNPTHLTTGTLADNNADRAIKGRSATGERNGSVKLTKQKVLKIRARYAEKNTSCRKLGQEFGVSATVISNIVRRKSWAHI